TGRQRLATEELGDDTPMAFAVDDDGRLCTMTFFGALRSIHLVLAVTVSTSTVCSGRNRPREDGHEGEAAKPDPSHAFLPVALANGWDRTVQKRGRQVAYSSVGQGDT